MALMDALTETAKEKSTAEKSDPAIERLKIYASLLKFVAGTVALGGVTLFFNEQYRNAQIELEKEKSKHALDLQDRKAEVEYLSKFVPQAMDKDIRVRVDFADYMQSVALSETLQKIWSKYFDVLNKKAREAEAKIADLNTQKKETAEKLTSEGIKDPTKMATQALVEKVQELDRELYLTQAALDKARFGSFEKNFFDFQTVSDDAAAAERAGDYARERDLLSSALDRIPKAIKPYFLARLANSYRSLH